MTTRHNEKEMDYEFEIRRIQSHLEIIEEKFDKTYKWLKKHDKKLKKNKNKIKYIFKERLSGNLPSEPERSGLEYYKEGAERKKEKKFKKRLIEYLIGTIEVDNDYCNNNNIFDNEYIKGRSDFISALLKRIENNEI
jgi:hypothetical protein